jgi:hypothetical protein
MIRAPDYEMQALHVMLIIGVLTSVGCGSDCPVFESASIVVTVLDGSSGSAICDAIVTATGPEPVVFTSSADDQGRCAYASGVNMTSGSYGILATATAYEAPPTTTITLSEATCETPNQQMVAITLQPNGT